MDTFRAYVAAEPLAFGTTLLLAITIATCCSDPANAQVFKDEQVCWGRTSSCSPSPMETKEQPYAPVQAQKRRTATPAPVQVLKRRTATLLKGARKGTAGAALKRISSAAVSVRGTNNAPQSLTAITHKVAIQVNQNDKAVMDLALNNAKNVISHYKEKGERVAIEIVTYGPGLHMLRADTSPVKERIAPMSRDNPNLAFIACGNTQTNQSKAEGKPVTLISEAKVAPSGVVRLMELQEQGYAYIRP